MCGKALGYNGKDKEKKCAKKKACGKALVDNGKEPIVTRAGSFEEQQWQKNADSRVVMGCSTTKSVTGFHCNLQTQIL